MFMSMLWSECCTQPGVGDETQAVQMEQQLYTAVLSTSSWLDGVENDILYSSVLLAENTEIQLQNQEVNKGFIYLLGLVLTSNYVQFLM